jgi:hypothetical protein
VPDARTVLIAALDLLPSLKERLDRDGGETLAFTDADALRALETIMKRRPSMVALERAFAATPRGAALINRIKADPSLARSEIRVISQDPEPLRAANTTAAATSDPGAAGSVDATGTRRAPRFQMTSELDVLVDGNRATLITLSVVGALVLSPTALKPNQRIRLVLPDEQGTVRLNATVVWSTFEIPHRYRAGIDFLDADAAALEAYVERHKRN